MIGISPQFLASPPQVFSSPQILAPYKSGKSSSRVTSFAFSLSTDQSSTPLEIFCSETSLKRIANHLQSLHQNNLSVENMKSIILQHSSCSVLIALLSAVLKSIGTIVFLSDGAGDFLLPFLVASALKATDFFSSSKLLESEQIRYSVINVHHEGQPMPGEEQEDIVMTSTQSILLNMTCPLTGKPIVELENPIRSMDCKHVYEKDPVMHYIISKKPKAPCPVAGCPKFLQEERVICDPLLRIEIDEIHAASKSNEPVTNVHDYTEIDFD
ncbi:E3 SUMO-protein ligase MMS21 [Platanthera zijinensis]|uniref:E3 SUMO-protein ligase MMS21 n=1 Tax=Platanthera zijinensis TaxID=2320716 RepID=A0AAP0BY61_9ASPA